MTKPRKPGRPESDDPRVAFPFRIRKSLLKKARLLGRERIEAWIERAKPDTKKP